MLWQCPRLKRMPLTLHIFEPFSHAFLLLLKVVRNCTAWAKVLGGLPRIPAKKALPLFLRRMQSSRSFKRGNKSSSPGREMKDKTKRIKCFGCEHISFHFLLLVTNNSPIWGEDSDRHLCKNTPQVCYRNHDNQREHLEHGAPFRLPFSWDAGWERCPAIFRDCTEQSWRNWGGGFHSPLPECLQSISKAHIVCMSRRWKLVTFPLSS